MDIYKKPNRRNKIDKRLRQRGRPRMKTHGAGLRHVPRLWQKKAEQEREEDEHAL